MLYDNDVFEDLGCKPQEYHIEIQQDATVVVHPLRRVPFSLYGKLKEPLDLNKVIKREHYKIPTVDKFR